MVIEEKVGGKQERRIVTGMIVDKGVVSAVAPKWDPHDGLFDSKWANIVGTWTVRHYTKYKRAPGSEIEGYFTTWSQKQKDKATVKAVEQFLSQLSGDYNRLKKQTQTAYVIDAAAVYFTRVRQRRLQAEMAHLQESGEVDKIEKLLQEYHRVEIGLGSGINLLEDEAALKRAFEEKAEPLIKYKGAIGQFFGDSLERDGFISFEAPEKRGKTFLLMDLAWQAIRQQRKVAFFELGDLSEGQALRRFAARAACRPLHAEPYQYPIAIEPAGDLKRTTATLEERAVEKMLTYEQALRAFKKLSHTGKDGPLIKLHTVAMSSLSVLGLESVLDEWERGQWVPDVTVTDYADIFAPVDGKVDSRDQTNGTWKGMRRISQQRHCLFLTATQTDADSYETDLIDMSNFSEDKRKRAHVTGSIGINQSDEEKEQGIYRLNWIVRREWQYSRKKVCHVAGCLALARPIILSTW